MQVQVLSSAYYGSLRDWQTAVFDLCLTLFFSLQERFITAEKYDKLFVYERLSGEDSPKGEKMKKLQKITTVFMILAAMTATMFGCTMSPQKQAFRDYSRSLQSDSEYWNTISEASNNMNTNDLTSAKAVIQASIIPNLEKIESNAVARNSAITDPELQQVDAEYVKCIQNLKQGYKLILEGINEQSQTKVQTAIVNIQTAVNNMKDYVRGMKSYMNKYGIKTDDSMDDILDKLNSF